MLTADKVKDYIKEIITPYLSSDITAEFHSEFYYNPESVANFTIKLLTGTIQAKVTQYPIQIFAEVDNRYLQDVIDALSELAITYNESIATIGDTTIRQFYTTPTVVGTFKNDGDEVKSTLSMDANFITFENLLDIKDLTLNGEKITFVRTAISYVANTNSTGALYGDTPGVVKQLAQSNGTTISFSVIPNDSTTIKDIVRNIMLEGKNMNKHFSVKMIFSDDVESLISCILVSGNFSKEINGFPLLEISFMRGDF